METRYITDIIISLLGGGGIAWVIVKLCIKSVAEDVINEKLDDLDEKYTTKEQMQIERKNLLEEVEHKFLTLAAFREFEKRMEKNFETIDRRLSDSSKRFDKLDATLEHITDLLIQRGD